MRKRILIRKLAVAFSMVAIFWYAYELKKEYSFFPLFKVFSFELFLAERLDPIEMLEKSFAGVAEDLRQAGEKVGEKLEIILVTDKEFAKSDNPAVFIVYKEKKLNGRKIKEYSDFWFNKKMLKVLTNNVIAAQRIGTEDDEFETDFEATEDSIKEGMEDRRKILFETTFTEKEYKQLKNDFPKLVYTKDELEIMKKNGTLISFLHPVVHFFPYQEFCVFESFRESSLNFQATAEDFLNEALLMYSDYFYEKKKILCWEVSIFSKRRWDIIVLFSICNVFFLHLISRDLEGALSERLERKNTPMPIKFYWQMSLKYWRGFFFSLSQSDILEFTERIMSDFEKYNEKLSKKRIAQEAKEVWLNIRDDAKKDPQIARLYKITRGHGNRRKKSLQSIEGALRDLKVAIEKFEKPKREKVFAASPVSNGNGNKKMGNFLVVSRREDVLSKLEKLSPKIIEMDFSRWSFNQLDNLRLALYQLQEEATQVFMKLLLERFDLKVLMKSDSIFMDIVRGNKLAELINFLSDDAIDSIESEAENKSPIELLPADLKITIIGGRRIYGRKGLYIDALSEMGPASIEFCEAERVRQIVNKANSDPTKNFLVLAFVPHGYSHLILNKGESIGLRWMYTEAINIRRFQKEVLEGYYGKA